MIVKKCFLLRDENILQSLFILFVRLRSLNLQRGEDYARSQSKRETE
jgi:hypothetical protein